MELTIDFLTGFLIFSSALILTILILTSTLGYPQPLALFEPKAYNYPVHLTVYRENDYLIVDCVEKLAVKVVVVCFNGDGSYTVTEGYTPLKLNYHLFIVAFSGSAVKCYGKPPSNINGYVTPHGIYSTSVELPYVYVDNGRVLEVKPNETGQFTLNIRRLITVNGTILLGGR